MNLLARNVRAHPETVVLAVLLLCFVPACKHRPDAREKQQSAFRAGQNQAAAQMMEARRTSIRVLGNVRNPEIQWQDDLSLAQVIVAAECLDKNNPRLIIIYRQRERIPVEPKLLLKGGDVPLEPGDTIEIRP